MNKFLSKFNAVIRKKDNLLIIVAVSAAVMVMLAVTIAFLLKPAKYNQDDAILSGVSTDDTQALRHPLTGAVLNEALEQLPQVFGVMIENSADAWPLTGLEDAFLVIEAPVEGNIPRFIAFFSAEADTSKLGPVRSARPYYIDWASEFEAVYAHVGGSPAALDKLATAPVHDLNEFSQGEYFWRDNTRYAPHNAYSSLDKLNKSLTELKLQPPHYLAWKFKDSTPGSCVPGQTCLSAHLDWGGGDTYDLDLLYNTETEQYLRAESNYTNGPRLLVDNVIVMATDISVIDNVGRRSVRTIGEGDALIFEDGTMTLGKWKKPTATDRLRFYDAAGHEVVFNAGHSLIEVVPALSAVTTSVAQ